MQTTIPQATAAAAAAASSEDQLLHRLHKAIQALPPSTASSRAIRLSALLQDYDGPLTIDRSLLESLLVASNEEIPPLPGGDGLLLEHGWCSVWWRRLRGLP